MDRLHKKCAKLSQKGQMMSKRVWIINTGKIYLNLDTAFITETIKLQRKMTDKVKPQIKYSKITIQQYPAFSI